MTVHRSPPPPPLRVASALGRQAYATGADSAAVAAALVEELLGGGELDPALVLVFADHRLRLGPIGAAIERACGAPCVVCATTGVISAFDPALGSAPGSGLAHGASTDDDASSAAEPQAIAVALSKKWARAGLGIARDLGHNAVGSARGATYAAAAALGLAPSALETERHVAISLFDGRSGHEESFCVGSAGAAPQVKFVGGVAWAEPGVPNLAVGETELSAAGVVILLESARPFRAVSSVHVEPSATRCVVTASHGRRILELDGFPAVSRYRKLLAELGAPDLSFDALVPRYPMAMYMRGTPYIRSIRAAQGEVLELTSAISSGQVLRVMRAGDLVGSTIKDLAAASEALGGTELLLAFSCVSRRRDALTRNLQSRLAASYASYPVAGFDSHGEQAGMVLVNHTLSGLAIGGGG